MQVVRIFFVLALAVRPLQKRDNIVVKPLPFSRLRVSEGRGVLAHYAEQEQTRETLAVFQREGTEGRECQYMITRKKEQKNYL